MLSTPQITFTILWNSDMVIRDTFDHKWGQHHWVPTDLITGIKSKQLVAKFFKTIKSHKMWRIGFWTNNLLMNNKLLINYFTLVLVLTATSENLKVHKKKLKSCWHLVILALCKTFNIYFQYSLVIFGQSIKRPHNSLVEVSQTNFRH